MNSKMVLTVNETNESCVNITKVGQKIDIIEENVRTLTRLHTVSDHDMVVILMNVRPH